MIGNIWKKKPTNKKLLQAIIITWGGSKEKYSGNFIKALEPLLSLGPLSSNINKEEGDIGDVHTELIDAFGGFPTVEDVLLRRNVIGEGDPVYVIVKVSHTIRKMIFCSSLKGFTNALICPKPAEKRSEVTKVLAVDRRKVVEQ